MHIMSSAQRVILAYVRNNEMKRNRLPYDDDDAMFILQFNHFMCSLYTHSFEKENTYYS